MREQRVDGESENILKLKGGTRNVFQKIFIIFHLNLMGALLSMRLKTLLKYVEASNVALKVQK